MAGAAGAAAGFGAASLLNTPLAAASARRVQFGGKSEPILMWASFLEAQQETFWKEQYLNPWNHSHPNIPISLVVKPLNSFAQLQQTAIEAGAGPDIVQEDGSSTVVPLAVSKQILALDDYAKITAGKTSYSLGLSRHRPTKVSCGHCRTRTRRWSFTTTPLPSKSTAGNRPQPSTRPRA